jgi:hypothetical protein
LPQSASVVQVTVGSSEQVIAPVLTSVTQVGVHVSKPSFPHVDFAAHRVTLPLQFGASTPHCFSAFTVCATQLTYFPWFPAVPQSHLLLTT